MAGNSFKSSAKTTSTYNDKRGRQYARIACNRKFMKQDEIQKLLDEFHVPKHIRRHCEKVAQICQFLGEKIPGVDLEMLHTAALLHDLVRICDFAKWHPENMPVDHPEESHQKWEEIRSKYAGQTHEQAAHEILSLRGHHDLAKLIKSHRFPILLERTLDTWEEKILYYADKRVDHDEIIPLEESLKRGKKRNAITPEQKRISDLVNPKVFELEQEICEAAGITPADI